MGKSSPPQPDSNRVCRPTTLSPSRAQNLAWIQLWSRPSLPILLLLFHLVTCKLQFRQTVKVCFSVSPLKAPTTTASQAATFPPGGVAYHVDAVLRDVRGSLCYSALTSTCRQHKCDRSGVLSLYGQNPSGFYWMQIKCTIVCYLLYVRAYMHRVSDSLYCNLNLQGQIAWSNSIHGLIRPEQLDRSIKSSVLLQERVDVLLVMSFLQPKEKRN